MEAHHPVDGDEDSNENEGVCIYCEKKVGLRPAFDNPVAHQSCQYERVCRETSGRCILCGDTLTGKELRPGGLTHRACKEYTGYG